MKRVRFLYEITAAHVRPADRYTRAQWHAIHTAIGPVQACDIGKRVYAILADDGQREVIQVENDAQRYARQMEQERRELQATL